MNGKVRVLHCPDLVGGNASQIARSERALGLASWCTAFSRSPFGYDADEFLWEAEDSIFLREIKRWKFLGRAVRNFDVIHFNFGLSILTWGGLFTGRTQLSAWDRVLYPAARKLELLDLGVIKRSGKVIAVTYQGDDARQGDYCARHFELSIVDGVQPGYYSDISDRRKRERIAKFDRYADLIYALNPDLLHVLPKRAQFLPYGHVDLQKCRPPVPRSGRNDRPLVVHAPSHQGVKGTPHVLDAIARLQSDGVDFEFLLIEGLKHSEAMEIYQKADLVIDQLLAGWYGGLAVEAMAFGKPCISYIRESDLKFLPAGMSREIPIVNAMPGTIYDVLKERLTKQSGTLPEVGRRSREYVENWHDPLKIAARLRDDYSRVLAGKRENP